MAFETMVDLLKDQDMDRLIEPCRRLWAFRQKKQELERKYNFMKNQRQLMEKQIQIQNSVLNNLAESMKRTDSGYTGRVIYFWAIFRTVAFLLASNFLVCNAYFRPRKPRY